MALRFEGRGAWRSLLLLLTALLVAPVANADSLPALRFDNAIYARVNPLGLTAESVGTARIQLYSSDSAVLHDNFAALVAAVDLSPALLHPWIGFQLQPLSILTIGASYAPMFYFGDFHDVQGFSNPNANFSDSALSNGDGQATFIQQFNFDATLRVKFGPVFARSAAHLHRLDTAGNPSTPLYYDGYYDMLLPRDGWFLESDADLGILHGPWVWGVRGSVDTTWYADSLYAPGELHHDGDSPVIRIGPLLAYSFPETKKGAFDAPTAFVLIQWYVEQRFRTGLDTPAWLPLMVAGFAFTTWP